MENYRKIERTSVPDQIFEQLKQSIIAGKWQPGESLPSEAQLSEDFGVSRMSVRAAIKKLETFGLIEVRMGEGSYVIEFNPAVFLKGLSPIFSKPKNALEILEFRKALEVECIKLGMRRADDHDIEVLDEIFREYWKALVSEDYKRTVNYDYRFHHQVFLMSKNSLFKEIFESMSELFFIHLGDNEQHYRDAYGTTSPRPEDDHHGRILKAFKDRELQNGVVDFTRMMDELVIAYEKKNQGGRPLS